MYKAIVFDLDGTAIPNKKDGTPSQHLINLIQKLKNNFFVCAATGRQISTALHVLQKLELISPCIIFGGTQIIDPRDGRVLWEKLIPIETVKKIIEIAEPFEYKLFISNEAVASRAAEKIIKGPEQIVYIMTVNEGDTEILSKKLKSIAGIVACSVPSYINGYFDIHITHEEGTKKHALALLLKILKVQKEEVIGFGDGNNDLPIFEAVGYKVAMGNGTQALKDVADLIAPSADEDGVAQVLEKLMVSDS